MKDKKDPKHDIILVLILLAWAGILVGGMELFPDLRPLVKTSWYYIGGVGALLMFYLDVKHKKIIIKQMPSYLFMVILGPVITMAAITYFIFCMIARKRGRALWT